MAPAIDNVNLKLADGAGPHTVDANGSDFSISGLGLQAGQICQGILIVRGAIDDTTGDETGQYFIQEKVSGSYRDIACFPQIGTTLDDNPEVDLAGKALKCYFVVSANATALRFRVDVGGTSPSYASVDININPLPAIPMDF